MDEIENELAVYAILEGSEAGEYLTALIDLWHRRDMMDTPFREAVQDEMQAQLTWFKANCEIVEETIEEKTYLRAVKELRYFDDVGL
jgi:hypothetical protein